jgi:hypothetical protein
VVKSWVSSLSSPDHTYLPIIGVEKSV